MKFNALVLIDCWDEEWIRKCKPFSIREFYGRIMDFTEHLNISKVYFCSQSKTHVWLENFFSNHMYVNDVDDLASRLSHSSDILLGGAAWQQCLHTKKEMNITLLRKFYNVYSHPKIVDSHMYSTVRISSRDFEEDTLPWCKKQNFFYLPKLM